MTRNLLSDEWTPNNPTESEQNPSFKCESGARQQWWEDGSYKLVGHLLIPWGQRTLKVEPVIQDVPIVIQWLEDHRARGLPWGTDLYSSEGRGIRCFCCGYSTFRNHSSKPSHRQENARIYPSLLSYLSSPSLLSPLFSTLSLSCLLSPLFSLPSLLLSLFNSKQQQTRTINTNHITQWCFSCGGP